VGALESERYVSLATFRRDGRMVATPVWAAPAGGHLYVFSAGDAGKVKRLRNSPQARLAPCTFRGEVTGEWVDAEAVLVDDPAEIATALTAFRRKYGLVMLLTDAGAKLSGRFHRRAYIRVTVAR